MQSTTISWADFSWNPTRGCSRISPGCKVELIESKLLEPLSWRAKAAKFRAKHGRRPRCFVNSMSDLFHESLPHWEIARVFSVMGLCREIDFLCLTKRADRMAPLLADGEFQEDVDLFSLEIIDQIVDPNNRRSDDLRATWDHVWPLPNVWLGVSVEDQRRADERIPHLLRTPAAVRFLSCEPLLEDIDIRQYLECPFCSDPESRRPKPCLCGKLADWVIVGGESGPGARPFCQDWALYLMSQCRDASTAFFMKQYGSNPWFERCNPNVTSWNDSTPTRIKLKSQAGSDPAEWHEGLRVQQFPEVRT